MARLPGHSACSHRLQTMSLQQAAFFPAHSFQDLSREIQHLHPRLWLLPKRKSSDSSMSPSHPTRPESPTPSPLLKNPPSWAESKFRNPLWFFLTATPAESPPTEELGASAERSLFSCNPLAKPRYSVSVSYRAPETKRLIPLLLRFYDIQRGRFSSTGRWTVSHPTLKSSRFWRVQFLASCSRHIHSLFLQEPSI